MDNFVDFNLDNLPSGVNGTVWRFIRKLIETSVESSRKVEKLQCRVNDLLSENTLLKGRLSRFECNCIHLKKEITEIKSRSMSENLIFMISDPNYKEATSENCVELVKQFLQNVMGLKNAKRFFIPVAHRLGSQRPGKSRQIIARFPVASEFKAVMDETSRLKNTNHFICRQMPIELRERQDFALPVYKEKKKNKKNNAKMVSEKHFLNGQLQHQFLPAKLPETRKLPAEMITVEDSSTKKDSGSTFIGYAANATLLADVRDARNKLLMDDRMLGVSDLMYTYRVGEKDSFRENFESDWDAGIGLSLLQWMQKHNLKNIVCFTTRTCAPGYKHIGNRRFEHSVNVCIPAVTKLGFTLKGNNNG